VRIVNMVIPDAGKVLWLHWALDGDGSDLEDFHIRLYQNNYTPDNNSLLANFTQSTFTGYAAVAALRSDFDFPVVVANIAYGVLSFVPTYNCTGGAPETAYGWYLEGDSSLTVLAAQRFDNPRVMAPGATEQLDPFRIALQTFH
jgi:hypothetical protein